MGDRDDDPESGTRRVGLRTRSTVAEQLVEVLVQAGVTEIFGHLHDGVDSIVVAVRRSGGAAHGGIDWVQAHNDESAALAASAQAQLTGRLAVCAGRSGAGDTHLIQGVLDAHRSGAPVLVLASHVAVAEIGTGLSRETHPEGLFAPASHWCELISRPAQLPASARIAIQHAVGLRGVAVMLLPADVAAAGAVNDTGWSAPAAERARAVPTVDVVSDLGRRLNDAGSVAILGGIGCAGARSEVLELADRLRAPVGHTLRGKESLQYDNPFDVGMTGSLGYGACFEALHQADLVLLLGTDFPYREFLPQRRTIQVDIDASRLGRRTPLELGVAGDVAVTVNAVLPLLEQKTDRTFLDTMLVRTAAAMKHSTNAYVHDSDRLSRIHPAYLATLLDRHADQDAVFTVDTGTCCTWAARHITPNGHRRLLGSWVHGTTANALPQAIGAAQTEPSRQVVSMSGDSGSATLLGELHTIRTHELPVKTIVFNDAGPDVVGPELPTAGTAPTRADRDAVDYAAIARAMGFHAIRVTHRRDLPDAVSSVLSHNGPALLDVVTDPAARWTPAHLAA